MNLVWLFDDLERESKISHLVVVSMKLIQQIGNEAFKEGKLRNIVCLDEFIATSIIRTAGLLGMDLGRIPLSRLWTKVLMPCGDFRDISSRPP
jgi:hypothetical protein